MMFLATNWTTAWLMTGIGFGVVFCILVILVCILMLFEKVTKSSDAPAPKKAAPAQKAVATPVAKASDAEQAAVATALYLYFRDVHDTESGVITIQPTANTAWHAVLNTRF